MGEEIQQFNLTEVQSKLKKYIEQGHTITSVARGVGYSLATISRILEGKYPGNVESVVKSITSFLERQEEIAKVPKEKIPFCKIESARKIFEIARICHNEGEIGVIYGEAGTGKTTAIIEYAKINPDVILIEADLGYTTKIFFQELHRKIGMDGNGTIHELFRDSVERLKDSGRLIIIDEAEHLPYRTLDLVRRIYDKAHIGILLVGLPRLVFNLRGKRGEYAQLYSRIGMAIKVTFDASDAEKIVHSMFAHSNGLYKLYYEKSAGNIRLLEKLIIRSKRIAKINKQEIDERLINKVSDMFIK
ncbi:MAG TPA: AAA family ATPase [Bacteroidota bacterium]|nr:AAA family ATPase [Bacteroidota bacterium]